MEDGSTGELLGVSDSLCNFSMSDYIVYVDESGDHSLTSIDPQYPVFVLAFCVFKKAEYADKVMPAVTRLKFKYFGHDQVVLHEREIKIGWLADTTLQRIPTSSP